jgi:site-specific recombinase XerC
MAKRVGREDALRRYRRWLGSQPLAERSKREYLRNVEAFCSWLAGAADGGWGGDPLVDPLARDYAARDFKRFLKVERGLRPASVNLALASLDSLYRCLGLGRPNVRREELPQAAPRALGVEQQRRLLRAAERASSRDRAIVLTMLFATVRLAELVALNVDDLRISSRKGVLVVRAGKGDAYREVPLNALARQVLDEWLTDRSKLAALDEPALFLSARGSLVVGARDGFGGSPDRPGRGHRGLSACPSPHLPDRDGPRRA